LRLERLEGCTNALDSVCVRRGAVVGVVWSGVTSRPGRTRRQSHACVALRWRRLFSHWCAGAVCQSVVPGRLAGIYNERLDDGANRRRPWGGGRRHGPVFQAAVVTLECADLSALRLDEKAATSRRTPRSGRISLMKTTKHKALSAFTLLFLCAAAVAQTGGEWPQWR